MLDKEPSTSNGGGTPEGKPTAYPTAKLLKDVEKAYDKGKKLLDESKKSSKEPRFSVTKSDNFKNWFGDWENDPANASKVVDENGEPRNIFTQAYYDAIVGAVEAIPTSTDTESAFEIYKKVQQSLNDLRENVELYRWLYLRTVNEETMENPANEPWGLREPFTSVCEEAEEIFIDEDYTKTNEYMKSTQ